MSVSNSLFLAQNVGSWVYGHPVVVDRDRATAFSTAINDPITARGPATSVTPMFCVIPIYSCLFDAVDLVTPEELRSTIVHGSHDIRFERPTQVGVTLRARARVTGLRPSRAGTAVTVHVEVATDDEALVSRQEAIALIRGTARAGGEATARAASPVQGSGVRVASTLRADQAARFAEASGDRNAVHLDDDIARAAGFDGVIMHGLCTLGVASGAAITVSCGGDAQRLKRIAARFAAPAYPRGELVTEVTPLDDDRHALETVASNGRTVLSHGLVEVRETRDGRT